ncbi:MAG: hypothetical protein ACM3NF_04745 [Gemmatimonadota bacterium]
MNPEIGNRSTGWILAFALALFAGIAGCAVGRTSVPTAEDLSVAGVLPGKTDIEAVRKGRVIFVTECGACHKLYPPGEYSPQEWTPIVTRMADRASLEAEQALDLEAYLTAASLAAIQKR